MILVKAVPQPSKTYGETVCCAGVTRSGEWRRLYPIRFRHLKGNRFQRWQWVRCQTMRRNSDKREESRRVEEETLTPLRVMPDDERPRHLARLIRPSVKAAMERNESLALIRPYESHFSFRRRSEKEIAAERLAYDSASRQLGMFDAQLDALEPCPYDFRLRFRDEAGWHNHRCEDWETEAAFWRLKSKLGEEGVLQHLEKEYNRRRPAKGLVLAMGNMAKYPKTWLLLGIFGVPQAGPDLFG